MPVRAFVNGTGILGRLIPIIAIASLASCGGDNPVAISFSGTTSRTFTVPAGSQFSVTLQTIGPGAYSSPPAVSSSVVRFRDVSDMSPFVPAGPTQRFRFFAAGPGNAIVTFSHTESNRIVEDTVQVR
jgi:hypothetical protein